MMRLVKYLNSDGDFDYQKYRKAQIEANHAKIHSSWVYKPAIDFLADYIKSRVGVPTFGICHGTRRGNEQAWFREAFGEGADIIGTEISDTANQFPHTVQHDFHDRRSEWVNRAEFVYSNSWDHAHDPVLAFAVWTETLKPNGLMILEHTLGHLPDTVSEMDPFGGDKSELEAFINENSGTEYRLDEILTSFPFEVPEYFGFLNFFVIKRVT